MRGQLALNNKEEVFNSCIYALLPLEFAVFVCKWPWASTMILLFDMWIENVVYMVK